jgi:hypothetical protein
MRNSVRKPQSDFEVNLLDTQKNSPSPGKGQAELFMVNEENLLDKSSERLITNAPKEETSVNTKKAKRCISNGNKDQAAVALRKKNIEKMVSEITSNVNRRKQLKKLPGGSKDSPNLARKPKENSGVNKENINFLQETQMQPE